MSISEAEEKGRLAAQKPLAETTLLDRDVIGCPYHTYKKLREDAPVNKDPAAGFFTITRYADIQKILRDTTTFSSRVGKLLTPSEARTSYEEHGGYPPVSTLLIVDPPKHKYYRTPLSKVFSGPRVDQMAPYIQQLVDELIDAFIDQGECDFVEKFARPLPLIIIADQLGVPRSDLALFRKWSDALTQEISGVSTKEQRSAAALSTFEFQKYFAKVIEEKRTNPTNDIISDMVRAHTEDDAPMSVPELLAILAQLLAAGNETTANSLSTGLLLLLRHPDQMQMVINDLSLVENLTEEVLRFDSPVQGLFRVTTCDTTVGETFMPRGSAVMLLFASANRDEKQFPDGEHFDILRKNAASHLSFGQGIHFCLGAMLARKEMNLALKTLLTRLKNIRLAPGHGEPAHEPSMVLRGLKELRITFEKA
jgi:cytochrome P450